MQETSTPTVAPISSGRGVLYISILFLGIIVVGSAILFVLTFFMDRSITHLESEVARVNHEIEVASQNKDIVTAKIIQENSLRPTIDLKNIVTNFRLAAIDANVRFDGFSISKDTISTMLISTEPSGEHPDPVSTIIAMMNKYSSTEQKFRLGKITSISGDSTERKTSIELKLVQTLNK